PGGVEGTADGCRHPLRTGPDLRGTTRVSPGAGSPAGPGELLSGRYATAGPDVQDLPGPRRPGPGRGLPTALPHREQALPGTLSVIEHRGRARRAKYSIPAGPDRPVSRCDGYGSKHVTSA